ncbi:hypothetical protein N7492_002004 [Penicillium capsulatum]|uniref:Peptidase S8/S53 domain-containing protein n=1 Tax=Penicillium capsulatum TaxID=69766 RepID=A0A9W9LVM6_9EURO|nr:hypothetical protein N7492_002004 [Penicillium capsulatum]KAJ6123376.1 hypothetical protein N7512_005841 [Penicillium capsulatum]
MHKISLLVLILCFLLLTIAESSSKTSYFIRIKDNTPLETLRSWIQTLDRGSGIQTVYEHVDHQSYVIELTPAEADEIKKTDFIHSVYERGEPRDARSNHAIPSSRLDEEHFITDDQPSHKPSLQQRAIVDHGALTNQKRWISWNEPGRPPITEGYVTDDNGGEGVDIYIMDTGFNVDLEELSDREIKPVVHYVSNDLAAKGATNAYPADIVDRRGHGTKVAILAAGKTLGIAPKSGLYLFKPTADLRRPDGTLSQRGNPDSYQEVMDKIITHIEQNQENHGRKSVVVTCQIIPLLGDQDDETYKDIFQAFIDELDELGVTLVIPAGNDGLSGKTTADSVLQSLGTHDNNVITVGGLNYDGTLFLMTTPEGTSGSITAYNLATHLTVMDASGTIHPSTDEKSHVGTSNAAPITAGMIAVLLGIKKHDRVGVYSDVNEIYDRDGVLPSAKKTKAYLKWLSFERSQNILPQNSQRPPYRPPIELNAVYNGARGPVC